MLYYILHQLIFFYHRLLRLLGFVFSRSVFVQLTLVVRLFFFSMLIVVRQSRSEIGLIEEIHQSDTIAYITIYSSNGAIFTWHRQ